METALTVLVVLACVLVTALIVERLGLLWSSSTPRLQEQNAELVELKAFTHGAVMELKNAVHNFDLCLECKAGALAERLARLEAKTDSQAAANLETFDRVLKLFESQVPKPTEQGTR